MAAAPALVIEAWFVLPRLLTGCFRHSWFWVVTDVELCVSKHPLNYGDASRLVWFDFHPGPLDMGLH